MPKSLVFNPFTGNFDEISEVELANVGSSPNAQAASISDDQVLTLQPADATSPGVVTAGSQSFGGNKTFNGTVTANSPIYADGTVDVTATGGTDTLNIGNNNADVINIGRSGATVNIQGTTLYENVSQLQVTDPLITINKGGGSGSGANSGIEIEENSIITAYVETSSDRDSWELKAPNTSGVVTITPGVAGFVIDQASHDPITLAAVGSSPNANAASLSGQVLNLQPADGTNPGVVSTTTQTFAGDKTFSGAISASNLLGTNTGDITLTAVGAIPNANGASLSGQALTLQPADGSNPGLITTGAQTIAGAKTFSGGVTATVTGTASGNTTISGQTNHGVVIASGTNAMTSTIAGNAGQVLTSNGVSADPTFQTAPGANSSYAIQNLGLSCSVAANALTIAAKQSDGTSDPASGTGLVTIYFRDPTSANGGYFPSYMNAATSIVVSAGSTLGTISGVPTYLWVYALNNSGVIELAISSKLFDQGSIISTTAEGGAGGADSATIMYSTTARSNVAFRLIGRILITNTSTNWTAAPTEVSLASAIIAFNAPTIQTFTSGSGTYTKPDGAKWLRVRMVGGGGGGGGANISGGSPTNGGTGGNTTFGSSFLTCNGGAGGTAGNTGGSQPAGGAGGTASIASGAAGVSFTGSSGHYGWNIVVTQYAPGGAGGNSPFGGAGAAIFGATGQNAVANTGSGGQGGGNVTGAAAQSGAGGGAGGYIDAIVYNPSGTYAYAVGGAGTAGTGAGANSFNGGTGAAGIIIVEEYYQ